MRGIAAREVDRDCVIERLCSRAVEDFPALSAQPQYHNGEFIHTVT